MGKAPKTGRARAHVLILLVLVLFQGHEAVKEKFVNFPVQRIGSQSIILYSGFSNYQLDQSDKPIASSEEICKEAIFLRESGKSSSVHLSTPECLMWRVKSVTHKSVQVYQSILKFDPKLNGVVSDLFKGGVCQSEHCVSEDGTTHWFLGENQMATCENLQEGFIEMLKNRHGSN